MRRASPKMRELSRRLVAFETIARKSSGTADPAAVPVCERLRPHLATLMGNAGFHALLSRSLAVTRADAEHAWLGAVVVKEDGSLGGWDGPDAQAGPNELNDGSVDLIARLLALLVAFIGENLTFRIVAEAWPRMSFNDLIFNQGDKYEEEN